MTSILRFFSIPFVLLALAGGPAAAERPSMDLRILTEGRVSIDNGPVMNLREFRARLESFKKQNPQPDLVARVDNGVPFGAVLIVIQAVRDAHYDSRLKVPGVD